MIRPKDRGLGDYMAIKNQRETGDRLYNQTKNMTNRKMESPKKANGSISLKKKKQVQFTPKDLQVCKTKRFVCFTLFLEQRAVLWNIPMKTRAHYIKANYEEILQRSERSTMNI